MLLDFYYGIVCPVPDLGTICLVAATDTVPARRALDQQIVMSAVPLAVLNYPEEVDGC
jgi:hypothetical protein